MSKTANPIFGGVKHDVVVFRRVGLGIAPHNQYRARFTWTPEAIAQLGTNTDKEIVKYLDLTRTSVTNKRLALGSGE